MLTRFIRILITLFLPLPPGDEASSQSLNVNTFKINSYSMNRNSSSEYPIFSCSFLFLAASAFFLFLSAICVNSLSECLIFLILFSFPCSCSFLSFSFDNFFLRYVMKIIEFEYLRLYYVRFRCILGILFYLSIYVGVY